MTLLSLTSAVQTQKTKQNVEIQTTKQLKTIRRCTHFSALNIFIHTEFKLYFYVNKMRYADTLSKCFKPIRNNDVATTVELLYHLPLACDRVVVIV